MRAIKIEYLETTDKLYKIKRYNDFHEVDYVGVYETNDDFNVFEEFQITYDSHCEFCHVIQKGEKIKLQKIKTCPEFRILQKVASA